MIESIVAEKKEFDIFYLLAYEKKLNNTPALSIQCIRVVAVPYIFVVNVEREWYNQICKFRLGGKKVKRCIVVTDMVA